jgi:structure-specific recognition protein 1
MRTNEAKLGRERLIMQEHDKVKRTLDEYFGIKVETRDTSLKGWNWGQMDVEGELLSTCRSVHPPCSS